MRTEQFSLPERPIFNIGDPVHWTRGAVGLQGKVENIEYVPRGEMLYLVDSEQGHYYAYARELGHGDAPADLRKWRTERLAAA